jgi:hypothetical protein
MYFAQALQGWKNLKASEDSGDIQEFRRAERDMFKRQIPKDFSVTSENRSSNITNGTKKFFH